MARIGQESAKAQWFITLNNPTAAELRDIWLFNEANGGPAPNTCILEAITIGWEGRTPPSLPRYHVFFELDDTSMCHKAHVRSWFPLAHVEAHRGTAWELYRFCIKEGVYRERGEWSWEKNGVSGRSVRPRLQSVPNFIIYDAGLRWQARTELFLTATNPDDATIIAFVEKDANRGTSQFCEYMRKRHDALTGQDHCEVGATLLYNGHKICLFDFTHVRARELSVRPGEISYKLLETIKTGMRTRTKYEAVVEQAQHTAASPHMILFMNRYPDTSALAFGRWHIIEEFDDEKTISDLFPPARFPEVANLMDPFDAGYANFADAFCAPANSFGAARDLRLQLDLALPRSGRRARCSVSFVCVCAFSLHRVLFVFVSGQLMGFACTCAIWFALSRALVRWKQFETGVSFGCTRACSSTSLRTPCQDG